ncbi:hypothetical protein Fmac_008998 [Flemingia macrophylla]|uniref:Uncharacterized protein n=1 Tax=Flemingia macrophylla TaxID=520843 RepID=A0ABD1N069_9FABA
MRPQLLTSFACSPQPLSHFACSVSLSGTTMNLTMTDPELSQATSDCLSGTSDSEEVGNMKLKLMRRMLSLNSRGDGFNYDDDFLEHSSNGHPSSSCISNTDEASQLNPRVGHEYQVEVPSITSQSEHHQLQMNPAESEVGHDNTVSFAIGLPIPVMWILNKVDNTGHEGEDGKTETNHISIYDDRRQQFRPTE